MIINGFTPSEAIFNSTKPNNKIGGSPFDSFLKDSLDKLNDKQVKADELTKGLATGADVDINDVMLSGEEANISLQLAVQMRNKVVEAVQELTRMQL